MNVTQKALVSRSHPSPITDDFRRWTDVAPISRDVNQPLDRCLCIVGNNDRRFFLIVRDETEPERWQPYKSIYGLPVNLSRAQSPMGFFDSEEAENEDDYDVVMHVGSSNTLEDELRASDPPHQFLAEQLETWVTAQKNYQSYTHRIEKLRDFALEDDECSDINESSKEDFRWFVESMPMARKAELVLMDNGNLRAVWQADDETHIGLQFLGDRRGEYVIFKRRPGSMHVSRGAGIDSLEGCKKHVRAYSIPWFEER